MTSFEIAPFDLAAMFSGIITATITGVGVFYAAYQIRIVATDQRRNESWRRTEFARQLVDRFNTDEELAFCARALDWGVGPLIVPNKYRMLFPKGESSFDHEPLILQNALRVTLTAGWNDPRALTYRYCFDAFFSYLDDIRSYVDSGLLTLEQLSGLKYSLNLVANPPYLGGDESSPSPLRPFVTRFYPSLEPFIWQQ